MSYVLTWLIVSSLCLSCAGGGVGGGAEGEVRRPFHGKLYVTLYIHTMYIYDIYTHMYVSALILLTIYTPHCMYVDNIYSLL